MGERLVFFDDESGVMLFSLRKDVAHFCEVALRFNFKTMELFESEHDLFSFKNKFFLSLINIILDCSVFKTRDDIKRFFDFFSKRDVNITGVCSSDSEFLFKKELADYGIEVIRIPCEFDFFRNKIKVNNLEKEKPNIPISIRQKKYLDSFIGNSSIVQKLKSNIIDAANADCTVLFEGESGTGKSFLAKIMYEISSRSSKKFVKINSSDLKEGLAKSDLYGTINGAFTGAVSKPGHFLIANGGVIFFDEIGNMHTSVQESLLTVLDSGTFYKVGSVVEQKVDVRFISATNANIKYMIQKGYFRKDFFNRISDYVIKIPSLSERAEDILDLFDFFLQKNGCNDIIFSESAKNFILNFYWPGNTRDIIRCSRYLATRYRDKVISPEILSDWVNNHCII